MNDLEKRVQALEKALSAFGKDLDSQMQRIGKELLKAAKREPYPKGEPAISEETVDMIKRSVQAIRCSDLSNVSQDVAIGVILAEVLLRDTEQQKRPISQK